MTWIKASPGPRPDAKAGPRAHPFDASDLGLRLPGRRTRKRRALVLLLLLVSLSAMAKDPPPFNPAGDPAQQAATFLKGSQLEALNSAKPVAISPFRVEFAAPAGPPRVPRSRSMERVFKRTQKPVGMQAGKSVLFGSHAMPCFVELTRDA